MQNGGPVHQHDRRIEFVIPYIGELPSYFDLFSRSVGYNQEVLTVHLITGYPVSKALLPPNIINHVIDRRSLLERVQRCLDLSDNCLGIGGHKLCDFRPFYGSIFSSIISQDAYWWGFCDLDMMIGDVGKWISTYVDDNADVVTAHSRYIAGHFTIVKNCATVNSQLFRMACEPSIKELLNSTSNQMIDEFHFFEFLKRSSLSLQLMPPLSEALNFQFSPFGITLFFDGSTSELLPKEFGLACWREGAVHYSSRHRASSEVLYVHFMGTKRWWHWLFDSKQARRCPIQAFSAAGYSVIRSPHELNSIKFRLVLYLANSAEEIRRLCGRIIRRVSGHSGFLAVRRFLISKQRY